MQCAHVAWYGNDNDLRVDKEFFLPPLQVQDTKGVTLFTGMLQSLKEYVVGGIDLDSFFIAVGEVFRDFLFIVTSN